MREYLAAPDRWDTAPILKKVKGPLVDFLGASDDERAEWLSQELKLVVKITLIKGVGRFEAVFDAIGLGGPVEDEPRRAFLELSEIRNAIVHRGGRADRRLVERCPWLGLEVGGELQVESTRFSSYFLAVHWYVAELAARNVRGTPDEHRLREVQGKYLTSMRDLKPLGTSHTSTDGSL